MLGNRRDLPRTQQSCNGPSPKTELFVSASGPVLAVILIAQAFGPSLLRLHRARIAGERDPLFYSEDSAIINNVLKKAQIADLFRERSLSPMQDLMSVVAASREV